MAADRTIYTLGERYVCPAGHEETVSEAIIPAGSGLAPLCVCGQPMVSTGLKVPGSWIVKECGMRHKPGRVDHWCRGTGQSVQCSICLLSWCAGVHTDCKSCDGGRSETCPACEGAAVIMLPSREEPCDTCRGAGGDCGDCEDTGLVMVEHESKCDRCSGRGEVACTTCGGSGKPSPAEVADEIGKRLEYAANADDAAVLLDGYTKPSLLAYAATRDVPVSPSASKATVRRKISEAVNYDAANATYDAMREEAAAFVGQVDQMCASIKSRGVDAETVGATAQIADVAGAVTGAIGSAQDVHRRNHGAVNAAVKANPVAPADTPYYQGG